MAEGDSFTQMMGAAATNRQPAVGVEEIITHIAKSGTTDGVNLYDGTTQAEMMGAGHVTGGVVEGAATIQVQAYSLRVILTNTLYLRKDGTTDRIAVGGVQVG